MSEKTTGAREERRRRRSSFASEALHHQLTHVSERYGLDAMVLADDGGHLWAAAPLGPAQTHLASAVATIGTLLSRPGFAIAQQAGRSVHVRQLRVGCTILFLAAQGAQHRTEHAVSDAAGGVERILGALL